MIDIIIIVCILIGGLIGFKNGFFKQSISLIGFILIVFLSFTLKGPIANFLCLNFPFLGFKGILSGVSVLNILFYELLAFIIIFMILQIAFKIVLFATSIFESLLKLTIILGIPSKILGFILGMVEAYIFIFFILFFLNQPMFNLDEVRNSSLNDRIINSSPFLTKTIKSNVNTFNEIYSLEEIYKTDKNINNFNDGALDIMLKYKITNVKTVEGLIKKNKITVSDKNLLNKYK